MPIPTDRQSFKDYIMRRLGKPVIEINIDDDQVDDRIDDAILYARDYHFDFLNKIYSSHQLTQADVNNKYITVDPSVISITKIFPLMDSQASVNMFDLRYQLRLYELYDFTSASYINYTLTMQHLRSLELLFTGQTPIRFQRHMQRLYIDWDWGGEIQVGQWCVAECYQCIDPQQFPDVWNDRFLKEYAYNLVKKQWGENLKKFQNVQLPGGVMLNGQQIFDEAVKEIRRLEHDVIQDYGGPPEMMMG